MKEQRNRNITRYQNSNSIFYHLQTVWLFTANDIKSIVIPETAFGIFTALSGSILTTNSSVRAQDVLLRVPKVILWNWINLLVFDIANQRLESSIVEDRVNKAWRPLPSGRISKRNARRLLLLAIPLCAFTSWQLGGAPEALGMMVLTWMYNDLGGSDEQYSIRNFINALGFMCYSSGSSSVAVGYGEHALNQHAYYWIAAVGGVVFTTLSMQDMPDIPGDKAKGRKTLPLVHGQTFARWAIGVPILFWSVAIPIYWGLFREQQLALCTVTIFGAALSLRILLFRSIDADKGSWKMWCAWTAMLYAVPLVKNLRHLRF